MTDKEKGNTTQLTALVVDDDKHIRALLRRYLEREGWAVLEAADGLSALRIFQESMPKLTLLDVMLPGMDGREVLSQIRKASDAPVILLTARDETADKVQGLELGADDYITKPFDLTELLARVRAVTRRYAKPEEGWLSFPNLSINLTQYKVLHHGKPVDMPRREMELLHFLASRPGVVFTRDQLLEQIWGYESNAEIRTVDVHIKRLREKLCSESEQYSIRTVWGVGYKFEAKA